MDWSVTTRRVPVAGSKWLDQQQHATRSATWVAWTEPARWQGAPSHSMQRSRRARTCCPSPPRILLSVTSGTMRAKWRARQVALGVPTSARVAQAWRLREDTVTCELTRQGTGRMISATCLDAHWLAGLGIGPPDQSRSAAAAPPHFVETSGQHGCQHPAST